MKLKPAPPVDLTTLVRDWSPGMVITEPGIYRGVPMDVYHSATVCDGPSVSSGVLRKIDSRSPKHGFFAWPGRPGYVAQADTNYFAIGRAVHHLAAGEADFALHFAVRPIEFKSWASGDAKEWRARQWRAGKSVLTPEEVFIVQGVLQGLHEHPLVTAGILQGLIEHSLFWKDPVTGIWCKARPDVLPLDSRMIVDLKTIEEAAPQKCSNSIWEHRLHIQLAMIHEGMLVLTRGAWVAEEHVLVFGEKKEPHVPNIKPLDGVDIENGRRQYRRALDIFGECLESGIWPGYPDDEETGRLPTHARERLAWEAKHGLLPPVYEYDFAPEEAI